MTSPTIDSKFVTREQLDKLGVEFCRTQNNIFICQLRNEVGVEEYILELCTENKTERYNVLDVLYYPRRMGYDPVPIEIKADGCRE